MDTLTCVVGMHRSGTSLTAQLCHTLGWPVSGSESQLGQGDIFNPLGYWEPKELTAINNQLLCMEGGNWRFVPRMSPGWADHSRLTPLVESARTFVTRINTRQVTWKDPRLSLTLPFWRPLLPSNTRYIVCLRHPYDVAESLRVRDHLDHRWGLLLWMAYTVHALVHTYGYLRMPLFYDDLIGSSYRTYITEVDHFLNGSSGFPGTPSTSIIRPDFSHGQHGLSPISDDNGGELITALWNALLAWRESGFTDDSRVMHLARSYRPKSPWMTVTARPLGFWLRYAKMRLLNIIPL